MTDAHHLLIIEDDETLAGLLASHLRAHGYDVTVAASAEAAEVLFAERARPSLILLDLNLPDMTGIDILEKVKANPHTKRSPVVVLTTTDDNREVQRCYDLGANVYITKPVNYEGFANAIRQLGLFFSVMQVPENP